jgi:dTMP kinase
MRETYGRLLPEMRLGDLAGKLIVIEGTDGAGRSTQIDLLKPWLEELGHAVVDTGMTRSPLAGEGIRRAKEGNNLGRVTQALFYATDFVDRLENEIVPALRAGFIVLTDRYIYSLMARAIVRGMDPRWIRSIYSVALKPDAVFYLASALTSCCRASSSAAASITGNREWIYIPATICSIASAAIKPRCSPNSIASAPNSISKWWKPQPKREPSAPACRKISCTSWNGIRARTSSRAFTTIPQQRRPPEGS